MRAAPPNVYSSSSIPVRQAWASASCLPGGVWRSQMGRTPPAHPRAGWQTGQKGPSGSTSSPRTSLGPPRTEGHTGCNMLMGGTVLLTSVSMY